MKTFNLALVVIALTLTTIKATNGPCVSRLQGNCVTCYRSKPNYSQGEGCGQYIGGGDSCAQYSYDPAYKRTTCSACKPGYAYNNQTSSGCSGGTIANCVSEIKGPYGNYCQGCKAGYYLHAGNDANGRSYNKGCVPASQVKNPVANCLNGGVYFTPYYGTSSTKCFRCQPGYNLVLDQCKKATIPGCMVLGEYGQKCGVCDFYDGYSLTPGGRCVKVAGGLSSDDFRKALKSLQELVAQTVSQF